MCATIPSMNGSDDNAKLRTLANILRLERQQGFRNRAVMGGLDAFIQRWNGELGSAVSSGVAYADMDAEQRRRWADDTLVRIGVGEQASGVGRQGTTVGRQPLTARQSPPVPAPVQSGSQRGTPRQPTPPPAPDSRKPSAESKPRSGSTQRRTPRKTAAKPIRLSDDVSTLGSVNSRTKTRLDNLGIKTVEDLIYHFPHRHDDFTDVRKIAEIKPGETQTLIATVWEVSETGRGRMKNAQATLGDDTGNIRVIWFNQGYLVRTLKPGHARGD